MKQFNKFYNLKWYFQFPTIFIVTFLVLTLLYNSENLLKILLFTSIGSFFITLCIYFKRQEEYVFLKLDDIEARIYNHNYTDQEKIKQDILNLEIELNRTELCYITTNTRKLYKARFNQTF